MGKKSKANQVNQSGKQNSVVAETANLLAGRSMVVIGGNVRPEAKSALERAFGLKELNWIDTDRHQSYKTFESVISRPDVAVVLLAIRWSSYTFGQARKLCERYGKPFVRLPAGYGPNQVAAQIVAQASHRLNRSVSA